MLSGPATILGGLPVIADVSFTRDYYGECDADVECLYWMKRDGSKGKPIPEHMYDRLPDYWQADVIESVSEHLAHEQWEREQLALLSLIIALAYGNHCWCLTSLPSATTRSRISPFISLTPSL
jgi:hypothetical protein